MTYTVTGPFPVVGQDAGSTLTDEQLDGLDIDWLVESGHLTATTEAVQADPTKEG